MAKNTNNGPIWDLNFIENKGDLNLLIESDFSSENINKVTQKTIPNLEDILDNDRDLENLYNEALSQLRSKFNIPENMEWSIIIEVEDKWKRWLLTVWNDAICIKESNWYKIEEVMIIKTWDSFVGSSSNYYRRDKNKKTPTSFSNEKFNIFMQWLINNADSYNNIS
jgi:DNA gyrase/topoisomerase IV subunit A